MKPFFTRQQSGYFDSGSFTPVHPKARAAINEVLEKQSAHAAGNPLSAHARGREAKQYTDTATKIIAGIHRIKEHCVLFSGSATEANLIAARTAVLHALRNGTPLTDMHFVVGPEEHPSVYQAVSYFGNFGIAHTIAQPTAPDGRLTPDDVVKCMQGNTVFLSIQYVNSQHGEIHHIADIADAARAVQPSLFVHTDAAQATAYFDCSPFTLHADAVTISCPKAFGPQGVGALLFQNSLAYVGMSGQHTLWDMHPGTPPVALIYGFAIALQESHTHRKENKAASRRARDTLIKEIAEFAPDTYVHGIRKNITEITPTDCETISPHLLYLSFQNINHQYLATLLDEDGFAVSTKTACSVKCIEALRAGTLPTTTEKEARSLARCIRKHLPLARHT